MRKIATIAFTRFVQLMKQPVAIVMMLVMPILFTAIFGSLLSDDQMSNRPHVAVVVGEDAIAKEAMRMLTDNDQYIWLQMERQEAEAQVSGRKVIAAIMIGDDIIPRIEASQPIFELMIRQKSGDTTALVPVVEGVGRLIRTTYAALPDANFDSFRELLGAITRTGQIEIEHQSTRSDRGEYRYVDLSSLGFTIMFMMFGISSAASSILEERSEGTWSRLLTTPTKKYEFLLSDYKPLFNLILIYVNRV